MNTKNLSQILLVMLILSGLIWLGRSNQAVAPSVATARLPAGRFPAASLTASGKFYDFGTISMARGKVSRVFEVTNPTDKDINLESVTTSCMCTAAYIVDGLSKKGPFGMPGHIAVPKANEVIRPGETRDIEVVYDPAAHGPAGVGPIDRFVYLVDADGNTIELEIKAVVTP